MSILKTERLNLRPLEKNDAEAMYKNWTYDERVARYCRWNPHESLEATEQLLKMYIDQEASGFKYRWGIELKETGELVGCIDVVKISEDSKIATVGYVLSCDYWNKGYATEALTAVIQKLFNDGFEVVNAEHHINNIASGKVMEKCGMKYTCNGKAQKKFNSDELCDVKWYEIKKEEV